MLANRWIRLTHRTSAAVLAAFLVAHFINHLTGLKSIAAHQSFMDAARLVYRSTALEPLLLAAVFIQIATGIVQVRAGWGRRRGFWAHAQASSGLYLAFFLANHTFWVLVARIGYGLDSNFYLAATFLTIAPLPFLFAPYYALGVFALFTHLACAVHVFGQGTVGRRFALATIAAGAVIAPVMTAVFMGVFYEISLPPAYRALVASYI
jgi:hypothetical protein